MASVRVHFFWRNELVVTWKMVSVPAVGDTISALGIGYRVCSVHWSGANEAKVTIV